MCAPKNPKELCPSTRATTGVICVRVGEAVGERTPALMRAMYEGIRFMPWVSTPRRSARTKALAIMDAFFGGTPLPCRTSSTKV